MHVYSSTNNDKPLSLSRLIEISSIQRITFLSGINWIFGNSRDSPDWVFLHFRWNFREHLSSSLRKFTTIRQLSLAPDKISPGTSGILPIKGRARRMVPSSAFPARSTRAKLHGKTPVISRRDCRPMDSSLLRPRLERTHVPIRSHVFECWINLSPEIKAHLG